MALVLAFSFIGCGNKDMEVVTTADGQTFKINGPLVDSYQGYGESDKDGKVTQIHKNDPRVVAVSDVVTQWADLTGNRSWETITGDEEYGLYSEGLVEALVNENDDINYTKNTHIADEMAYTSTNFTVPRVVMLPNGHALATVEYDQTLTHCNNEDSIKNNGFKKIGDIVHCYTTFELLPVGGIYKISAVDAH